MVQTGLQRLGEPAVVVDQGEIVPDRLPQFQSPSSSNLGIPFDDRRFPGAVLADQDRERRRRHGPTLTSAGRHR